MKRSALGGLVAVTIAAAGLSTIVATRANEDCAQMFDKFATEMDGIANAYDKMKTHSEVCEFMRSKDIPAHRRILAWVEANYRKCDTGTKALQFARSGLQKTVAREKQECH